jgi:hypothetical protein
MHIHVQISSDEAPAKSQETGGQGLAYRDSTIFIDLDEPLLSLLAICGLNTLCR